MYLKPLDKNTVMTLHGGADFFSPKRRKSPQPLIEGLKREQDYVRSQLRRCSVVFMLVDLDIWLHFDVMHFLYNQHGQSILL